MADSISDSTKSWEGEGSHEGKAYVKLRFDMRGLVWKKCSIEFKSWKMVPVDLKKSMMQKLSKRMFVDHLFKLKFRQYKFDVQ
ncbi:hypothetical protein D8674_011673 [Pyrus ussuriensis x Pyrus communis]|uniref:Uncharacterized protein n=1 Tax=Pyrus ussuriensis x Pyrus communis TaxID=2448454 RepID=A0A5N5FZE6_9ROSA|nr:hypothetical protein D8674_011673 [Pyrus ussuriensis x Pyrus communis]